MVRDAGAQLRYREIKPPIKTMAGSGLGSAAGFERGPPLKRRDFEGKKQRSKEEMPETLMFAGLQLQ